MNKQTILVTGADGQLGKTLQQKTSGQKQFFFTNKETLDITDNDSIKNLFNKHKFKYCINFAAYTNVEKAETNSEQAFLINEKAVANIAMTCKEFDCKLIHISTDYVFDGKKINPYTETDMTSPLNVYGKSKLAGEKVVLDIMKEYFIIRTSWLYSEFKTNFYKTILRISESNQELKIINDQYGTPTYTGDLIDFILFIIDNKEKPYGIYHFSNEGKATWFDFASKIIKYNKLSNKVLPIESQEFVTKAKRPNNSVLSKEKIKKTFNFTPRNWDEALFLMIKKQ